MKAEMPAMDSEDTATRVPVPPPPVLSTVPLPVIRPSAPQRYRVQFTIGEATHEKLRRLQTLLRREIPDGDPAAIFDRAVALLLADVEGRKLGGGRRTRIRPRTDAKSTGPTSFEPAAPRLAERAGPRLALPEGSPDIRTPPPRSRTVPRAVRREVWSRDGGQCAYVSPSGRRCTEGAFLEFHHVDPYARGGPATLDNIGLRCRRHNQYESEIVFGPRSQTRAASAGTRPAPAYPSSNG